MEDNLKNIAKKTLDDFFSLIEENHEDFDVDFEEEVLKFTRELKHRMIDFIRNIDEKSSRCLSEYDTFLITY